MHANGVREVIYDLLGTLTRKINQWIDVRNLHISYLLSNIQRCTDLL